MRRFFHRGECLAPDDDQNFMGLASAFKEQGFDDRAIVILERVPDIDSENKLGLGQMRKWQPGNESG